jgi:hypothetical protein
LACERFRRLTLRSATAKVAAQPLPPWLANSILNGGLLRAEAPVSKTDTG